MVIIPVGKEEGFRVIIFQGAISIVKLFQNFRKKYLIILTSPKRYTAIRYPEDQSGWLLSRRVLLLRSSPLQPDMKGAYAYGE